MKNIIYIFVLFSISTFFVGCEDLHEEVGTEFVNENFYENEQQLFSASVGMARELSEDPWFEFGLRSLSWAPSKHANHITAHGRKPAMYQGPPTFRHYETPWNALYETIGVANSLIKYAPSSPVDESLVDKYVAEARFYRAWSYFTLVRVYGGVPLYTEPVESATNENLYKKRNSTEEVYNQIVKDLQYATEHLPMKQWSYNSQAIRPRAAAAITLLGQVYLTMAGHPLQQTDKYNEVINVVKPLLDSESDYGVGLVEDWISIFDPENDHNKELLFLSGSDPNTMGSLQPFWTAPPRSGRNYSSRGTYRMTIRNSLIELYSDGFADERLSDGFFWSYQTNRGDTRVYWWPHPDNTDSEYFGYYYYDIDSDTVAYDPDQDSTYVDGVHPQYSGDESGGRKLGISTRKFVSPDPGSHFSHKNQKLWLRLPVAYLSLAEAYCETGDLANAKLYLNKLRNRAGASDITTSNQSELRQIIREEWARELHMEFVSLFNFRRWDTGQHHYVNNIHLKESSPPWTDDFNLFPIPGSQLSAHPGLEQNPGW